MTVINLLQLNVNRSKTEMSLQIENARKENIHIICAQETPCTDIGVKGVPRALQQYMGPESNKQNSKTAIIITQNNIITNQISTNSNNITGIKLKTKTGWIEIFSVYLPPERNKEREETMANLTALLNPSSNAIICGDFNARHTTWGDRKTNRKGKLLDNWIDSTNLKIINEGDQPTYATTKGIQRRESVIDLTLSTNSIYTHVNHWRVNLNIKSTSDHTPITFSIHSPFDHNLNMTTKKYNTSKADWEKFKTVLLSTNLAQIFDDSCPDKQQETLSMKIQNTCDKTLKKWKPATKIQKWYTDELRGLASRINALRRSLKSCHIRRIPNLRQSLGTLRMEFRRKMDNSRRSSWMEFCSTLGPADCWDINKIMTWVPNTNSLLLRMNNTSLTEEATVDLLMQRNFPVDDEADDTEEARKYRLYLEEPYRTICKEPPFTTTELQDVFKNVHEKKTPGYDGFNSVICEAVRQVANNELLAIYNNCLEKGIFPRGWKIAVIKFIPKPGKTDYGDVASYRPIGLLPMMGKALEKLIHTRIIWHLLKTNYIHPSQYGFLPGKSTEEALLNLHETIITEQQMRKHTILLSLDIQGAFDNAWWPIVIEHLKQAKVSEQLVNLLRNYLRDRWIEGRHLGVIRRMPNNRGCIQGSVLGPLLWILIINPLLYELSQKDIRIQAFADDLAILISGNNQNEVQDKINEICHAAEAWAKTNKMRFSPGKSELMQIGRRQKIQIEAKIQDNPIKEVNVIKVLGVHFDSALTFNHHANKTIQKTRFYIQKISKFAKSKFGYQELIYKHLYNGVVIPKLCYGISTWGKLLEKKGFTNKLTQMQRNYIIHNLGYFRTTSYDSCWSLSGQEPIVGSLTKRLLGQLVNIKKETFASLPRDRKLEPRPPINLNIYPPDFSLIRIFPDTDETLKPSGYQYYTDGSKLDASTGAGVCLIKNDNIIYEKKHKLESYCSVYQAELLAIETALMHIPTLKIVGSTCIDICSDSKSAILSIGTQRTRNELVHKIQNMIVQHQKEGIQIRLIWVKGHSEITGNEIADYLAKQATKLKARPVFDYIPKSHIKLEIKRELASYQADEYKDNVSDYQKNWIRTYTTKFPFIENPCSKEFASFITGHGPFTAHLKRIYKTGQSECALCNRGEQTSIHILWECDYYYRTTVTLIGAVEDKSRDKTKKISKMDALIELYNEDKPFVQGILIKLLKSLRRINSKK